MTDPTVRLAYNPGPVNAYHALDAPTVRLAFGNSPPERNGSTGFEHEAAAPTVRLAMTTAMGTTANDSGKQRYPHHVDHRDGHASLRPALLVSYVYLPLFLKHEARYQYRDWVLDSGAFSAHHSGTEIKLQEYIDTCRQLIDTSPLLTEVFALDVIGDWRASRANCEEMWRQNIPAIPCYHHGEPWDVLVGLARDYPKIALGGAVGLIAKTKLRFAGDCFAKVWPKAIHGFGFGSEAALLSFPFHSVDATNWELGPCAFGRWQKYGKLSVRGSKQNLRGEVQWYLALEEKARIRWRKEMAALATEGPNLRLALQTKHVPRIDDTLAAPSVRLAVANDNPTAYLGRYLPSLGTTPQTEEAPTVRLAYAMLGGAQRGAATLTEEDTKP